MGNFGVGQYDPLASLYHVEELVMKEGKMVLARFVRAPKKGALDLSRRPRRCGKPDRRAARFVQAKKAAGRVRKVM